MNTQTVMCALYAADRQISSPTGALLGLAAGVVCRCRCSALLVRNISSLVHFVFKVPSG